MPRGPTEQQVHDTLRLSPEEHAVILAQLDATADHPAGLDRRAHRRLRYRGRPVTVVLRQPGGNVGSFAVKPHNLSCGGLSFLHGTFVHTGAVCDVTLRTVDQRDVPVPGRVVRCRLIRGRVHEVGVAFYRSIDVCRFIPDSAPVEAGPAPCPVLPRFSGQVLCLDPTAPGDETSEQCELLRVMASEFGVEMELAKDPPSAIEKAMQSGFDLVLARIPAPGPSAIATLRAAGYPGPLVALADHQQAEAAPHDELAAWTEGCDCIVSLPLTFDRLADLFDDYLMRDWATPQDRPPLVSSHWSKVRMRPLILKFLARLDDDLRHLQSLLHADRPNEVERACRRLIGNAETYGYETLAAALRDLEVAVVRGEPPSSLRSKLTELLSLAAAAQRARDEIGGADVSAGPGVRGGPPPPA